MAPYYADDSVTLHLGDCLAVLTTMDDASVDAVVCDPPYGLEFMGREWDGADGFRRSLNEADAGRDSVFGRTSRTSPEYRTGKPSEARIRPASEADQSSGRAHNATTSLVARNAPEAYVAGHLFQEWCEAWARQCMRILKPGGHLLAFGGTRTWHRLACGIEDAGFEIRDSIDWIYGSGFPKNPACLKPAHEPIIMARKPSGKSAPLPGLDACRVEHVGEDDLAEYRRNASGDRGHDANRTRDMDFAMTAGHASDAGRWPPNVLLAEETAAELDKQSGVLTSGTGAVKRASAKGSAKSASIGAESRAEGTPMLSYGDTGGASRFFPVFRYEPKAPKSERPKLPDGTAWPTVKPLDLMRWLVRLVTPPDGTVLDLFAGSGTTGEACVVEGFRCILVDKDPVAAELIKTRLAKPIQPVMFGLDEAS